MPNRAWRILLIALCFACGPALAATTQSAEKLDAQVARLIGQLGDDEYSVRERAQQELLKFGVEAFDALDTAQSSDDVEIATRARYLLLAIRSDWTVEGDLQEVKDKLKDYDQRTDDERKVAMKELAMLPADDGIAALCRLVRFEDSAALSKDAAVIILNQELPDEKAWARRAGIVNKTLGRSKRPGADWLRAYVLAHENPEAGLAQWVKLTDAELQTLQQQPSQTHSRLVMELLRRQVDLLDRLNRPDDALSVIRKMVQVQPGDPREPETLTELVKWLARRKVWSVVDEVAAKFASNFESDALLLYTLAEARLEQGKKQLADETADKALKLSGEKIGEHFRLAVRLQERGLEDWSDGEYGRVIQIGPAWNDWVVRSQFLLSESLHDREREMDAAKVLELLLKAVDADNRVAQMVPRLGRNVDSVRSRMNFFYANDAAANGNMTKHVALLDTAIAQDASDVDVLIGLYRLPDQSPARREKTLRLIRQCADETRKLIDEDLGEQNSNNYNQMAWLVANTEGDYDEAIRCSQRSIELRRAGGYLDTLGRCYFAKAENEKAKGNYDKASKNYEQAVKQQSEAVKMEPYTRQIGRQLIVFRKALDQIYTEHPETRPSKTEPAPADEREPQPSPPESE